MKNRPSLPAFLLAFSLSASLSALPKVAILDVSLAKDVDQSLVVPITETMMEVIVGSRAYTVLDRAYVEQVLKEREFQLSGLVSDDQVAKAGQYLGADFVIAGKGQLAAGSYFLVAKMIDVKTGVIVSQATEQSEGKVLVLLDLARKVAVKLVAGGSGTALLPTAGPAASATGRLKVGFIDNADGNEGNPFESARLFLQSKHGEWLETVVARPIVPDKVAATVDNLVAQGCTVIFDQEVDHAKAVFAAAGKYPSVHFWLNAVGGDGPPNVGSFGADTSRMYYLAGLIAGAVTKTGKLAFIAWVSEPWQIRNVNEFALGARAANPRATVYLRYVAPAFDFARVGEYARALIAEGCDVFGPIDIANVYDAIRAAAAAGKQVLAFGDWSRREDYKDFLIAGPLFDWSVPIETILVATHEGRESPRWMSFGAREGAARLGGRSQEQLKPEVIPLLRARIVKTPDLGSLNAFDLLMRRMDQIKSGNFESFVGPLRDQKGKLRLAEGSLPPGESFFFGMDWLLDNVRTVK